MKISMREVDYNAKIMALQAIQSPVTQQVIKGMIQKYLEDVGIEKDIEFSPVISDYKPGSFNVGVYIYDNRCYDWLMNQPSTSISDSIDSRVVKRMVFVSHGYSECAVTFNISCSLPDEDFKTLDMIGKVHREFRAGYFEQSIYCEI